MRTYTEIVPWFEEQRKLIDGAWDNIHLVTGEEGTWKSLWMRKCARFIDDRFDVSHIHFTQDDFLADAAALEPGRAIVLDEFRGHRRLAMHGDRMEFLDFLKECRAMSLNVWIGYPHVSQFERDILNNRIRWWEHKPNRPEVQIRERKSTLIFERTGEPTVSTKFPLVARFNITGKNDPLRPGYEAKKAARMKDRGARFAENHDGKAAPQMEDRSRRPMVNASILEHVQAELKR